VRNCVSFAVEELLSFTPRRCHSCYKCRDDLKQALMQYLLWSTNLLVHGTEVDAIQTKAMEARLAEALAGFHAHRLDTHFVSCFAVSEFNIAVRNAS
jgi:PP-loop superfamily ATP-utilizing enzyme